MDERFALLETVDPAFEAPVGNASEIRDRFREWVRCYADYPIAIDSETVMATEWPTEDGKGGTGYRVTILEGASGLRVRTEISTSSWTQSREFALWIESGVRPILSGHNSSPCSSTESGAPTGS